MATMLAEIVNEFRFRFIRFNKIHTRTRRKVIGPSLDFIAIKKRDFKFFYSEEHKTVFLTEIVLRLFDKMAAVLSFIIKVITTPLR